MRIALWDRSIEIRLASAHHLVCVNNSRDALRYLKTEWPVKGGKSQAAARTACKGSISGSVTATIAMEAFESAARDADMLP